MKQTYFKYFFNTKGLRYQQSLIDILNNFTKVKCKNFKSQFFAKNQGALYLFKITSNIFMLTVIKDDELIKAIDTNKFSQADIHSKLSQNESLDFASYVYVDELYYGIASSFYGPKNGVWMEFINTLIRKLTNSSNVVLESEALPTQIDLKGAKKLEFKSSVAIRINSKYPKFEAFKQLFGIKDDAKKLDFVLSPEPRKDMEKTVDAVLEQFPLEDGLERFIIKGRAVLDDMLTEHYLVGTGHISDVITGKTENDICSQMNDRVAKNRKLENVINEFKEDPDYVKSGLKTIANLADTTNWPGNLF